MPCGIRVCSDYFPYAGIIQFRQIVSQWIFVEISPLASAMANRSSGSSACFAELSGQIHDLPLGCHDYRNKLLDTFSYQHDGNGRQEKMHYLRKYFSASFAQNFYDKARGIKHQSG